MRLKSPMLEASVLANIANALVLQKKYDSAQLEIARAQLVRARNPSVAELSPLLWGVQAEVDFRRHRIAAALEDLDKAFKGLDLASTDAPFHDIHEFAYEIYRQTGEFRKATAHLEAYKRPPARNSLRRSSISPSRTCRLRNSSCPRRRSVKGSLTSGRNLDCG